MALTIAGIPFTDNRLSREAWLKLKPDAPYGALPTAKIDGQEFAQSNAILRYCGKLSGLYPEDPKEALFADEIIDMMEDCMLSLFMYKGDDKEQLRAVREKAVNEAFPRYLGGLEKRLGLFGEGPWAVGGKLSTADLAIYANFHYLASKRIEFIDETCIEKYVKMMKIFRTVSNHPKVVAWNKAHA